MSQKATYIQNVTLQKGGEDGGDGDRLRYYYGDASTQSRNSQAFKMSPQAIIEIAKQLNKDGGIPVYQRHQTYGVYPSGKTVSGRLNKGKARTKFYVQKDVPSLKTNELIDLMDAGTVDSLSLGIIGDYKCDKCGEMMEASLEGWFSIVRKCDNGHRLGYRNKKDGGIYTATMVPPIRVLELSVVGAGADPGAKVIGQLQAQLTAGDLSEESILALSEMSNIDHHMFCEQLGFDPKPTKRRKRMSKPDDLLQLENDKLTEQVEELEGNIETLTTEKETAEARVTELETQMADLPDADEVEALQEELDTVKEQLKTKTKLADEGERAITELRSQYKRWFVASYIDGTPSDEELAELDETLADKTVAELKRGINRLRTESLKAKKGGRQSVDDEDQLGKKGKKSTYSSKRRRALSMSNELNY